MSRSLNVKDLRNRQKILIYNSFSLQEFAIQLASVPSFLRDSKLRALIVVDSYNTYLLHDAVLHAEKINFNEKHNKEAYLDTALTRKIFMSLLKLKEKFGCTTIMTRKEHFTKNSAEVITNITRFRYYGPLAEQDKGKLIDSRYFLLEPHMYEDGAMIHAISKLENSLIGLSLFKCPLEWIFKGQCQYEVASHV